MKINIIFVTALSFHQPKFCANVTWNPNALSFVGSSNGPFGIFIDLNDTVYVTEQSGSRVTIWAKNGTAIRMLSGQINNPGAIFVSDQGDIYVDGGTKRQIFKWAPNSTNGTVLMNISSACFGLFIDTNNTLYFSLDIGNQVIKVSLNGNPYSWTVVAGNGSAGLASNQLNHPNGIFVTVASDLYVADSYNNRIQLFRRGQPNGIKVVGYNTTPTTTTLDLPTGVTLDADGRLFIADSNNHRIVIFGPNGIQCIPQCAATASSSSNALQNPRAVAFDSYGNIYVSDYTNGRIQKFLLMTNSCGKSKIITIN